MLDYGIDFRWTVRESARPDLDEHGFDHDPPEVVVVGAGPTGLTVAAGLARFGVRVTVLEADGTVCRASRASGISERTFETLNRVAPGRGDKLAGRAIPTMGSESFFGDRLMLRQVGASRERTGGAFSPNSYLSQWNIEAGLVEELSARPEAQVRWQHQVSAVRSLDDGVELTVSAPEGPYKLRAPWLVAADGSRSTVRRCLDLRMSGLAYDVSFVIVDARITSPAPTPPPIRRVWFDPDYLPGGLLLRHMSPDGIWRMDFQLPIGADLTEALAPEFVTSLIWAHLRTVGHPAQEVRPIWISAYQARALSLERYRHARVLFVGDAAHLVPIFGGFGLNSGIDDAENLAWKLGLTVTGATDERLVDSYSAERVPAVRGNLEFVTRAAEFMTPTSAGSQQLRRAALTLAAEGNLLAAGMGRHRPFRSVRYPESVVVLADQAPLAGGFAPGERAGQGRLRSPAGERVYLPDQFGGALTLLVFGADSVDAAPATAAVDAVLADTASGAWARRGVVPVRVLRIAPAGAAAHGEGWHQDDGEVTDRYGAREGAVYLIRPDGVVAARWPARAATRQALARALRTLLGLRPEPGPGAAESERA